MAITETKSFQNNDKCVILDFDCTISAVHTFYFMHDGNYAQRHMNVFSKQSGMPMSKIINIYEWLQELLYPDNDATSEVFHLTKDQLDMKVDNKFTPNELNQLVQYLFGGTDRIAELAKVFKSARDTKHTLIIGSRGNLHEIVFLLKMVDLFKYMNFILATNNQSLYSDHTYIYPKFTENGPKAIVINSSIGKVEFINKLISLGYVKIAYVDDDKTEFDYFKTEYCISSELVKTSPEVSEKVYSCRFNGTNKQIGNCPDNFGYLLFIGSLTKNSTGLQTKEISRIESFLNNLLPS